MCIRDRYNTLLGMKIQEVMKLQRKALGITQQDLADMSEDVYKRQLKDRAPLTLYARHEHTRRYPGESFNISHGYSVLTVSYM